MLVEQLSIAFKCQSAIGNSNNLNEMIHEVLRAFVNETYAIYSEFCIANENNKCEKLSSFGKKIQLDYDKYSTLKDPVNLVNDDAKKIIILRLENGSIFLVSKNLEADCSFFFSMFESLIPKLNLSVNACLNVEKLILSKKLLEKQKEELINANKTKDDFLANMSHELKTPLNSIIILSSIMKKNKNNELKEKELKNVSIINNSANDLLDLINDVLDISKIAAGEINILKDSFDLKEFILDEYEILKPLVSKKDINFTCEFNIKETMVFSDKLRLKQILKNLISNAIKFTDAGTIELFTKEYKDYYEVTLKDSGIGIEENKLLHIFDRFKQVETSTNRVFKGTGLGLAISKELASLLCCTLNVESQVGIGSTFTLQIPKNQDSKLCICEEEKKEIKEVSVVESKSKKEILFLHSNSLKQFSFTIALKKHFDVRPFDTTQKLIDFLEINKNNKLIVFCESINNKEELKNIISNNNDFIEFKKENKVEELIQHINKIKATQ
ncbi:sensor histidine kinase [Arcobacter peruensis]|uniref:sensor histidine kinase n=1 Tax=Arcobacter peruensis TaxID=2320140 RepID=UPI000F0928E9|nr:HAMP domain-containing sensor histidine kinase [Arcobacter peruensis]